MSATEVLTSGTDVLGAVQHASLVQEISHKRRLLGEHRSLDSFGLLFRWLLWDTAISTYHASLDTLACCMYDSVPLIWAKPFVWTRVLT